MPLPAFCHCESVWLLHESEAGTIVPPVRFWRVGDGNRAHPCLQKNLTRNCTESFEKFDAVPLTTLHQQEEIVRTISSQPGTQKFTGRLSVEEAAVELAAASFATKHINFATASIRCFCWNQKACQRPCLRISVGTGSATFPRLQQKETKSRN